MWEEISNFGSYIHHKLYFDLLVNISMCLIRLHIHDWWLLLLCVCFTSLTAVINSESQVCGSSYIPWLRFRVPFPWALTTVPPELKPKVTKKFVDDSLSAVKKNAIKPLTDHMNKLDPTGNITYTIEMPENNQIPCLDALFHIKPDGTLKTSVYRKKTHTDLKQEAA